MLPKYVTIKLSDGSVWGLPIKIIVEHYAAFFRNSGITPEGSINLATEHFEKRPLQLQAWISAMKWSDFQGQEIKIADAKIDYDQELRTSKEKGFFS